MFRRAVSTIEGVKADALFSYQPPVNLIALCIMLPARYILTPRWFHKFNVFMIRATNLPFLLIIAWYERTTIELESKSFTGSVSVIMERVVETLPRTVKRLTLFEGLFSGIGSDLDVIFDIEEDIMNSQGDVITPSDLNAFAAKGIDPVTGQMRVLGERRASGPTSINGPSGRAASPVRPSAQPLGTRPRKSSIAFRAIDTAHSHSHTSPLAQIYPPLVVDDDIAENVETTSTTPPSSSAGAGTLAPTGPRRRLSSMHRFPPVDPNHAASSTALRRFPTATATTTNSSLGAWRAHVADRPLQASPSNVEESQNEEAEAEPELASRLVDEDDNTSNAQVGRQLERIEERQRKLEEMLTQIIHTLGAQKS